MSCSNLVGAFIAEGFNAYGKGVPRSFNPYRQAGIPKQGWSDGWDQRSAEQAMDRLDTDSTVWMSAAA